MNSNHTRIMRALVVALVLVPGTNMTGCKSTTAPQEATPAPAPSSGRDGGTRSTTVTGRGYLRAGSAGNLGNSMAAIYRSLDEWNNYMPVAFVRVQGNGPEISFSIDNLVPGTYYLDIWKDVDNSQTWSPGDFVGWFGNGALGAPALTPFQVRDGRTFDVGDLLMYLIPNAAKASKTGGNDR